MIFGILIHPVCGVITAQAAPLPFAVPGQRIAVFAVAAAQAATLAKAFSIAAAVDAILSCDARLTRAATMPARFDGTKRLTLTLPET